MKRIVEFIVGIRMAILFEYGQYDKLKRLIERKKRRTFGRTASLMFGLYLYQRIGELDRAREMFRQLVASKTPAEKTAHFFLFHFGQAALDLGNYPVAISDCELVLGSGVKGKVRSYALRTLCKASYLNRDFNRVTQLLQDLSNEYPNSETQAFVARYRHLLESTDS